MESLTKHNTLQSPVFDGLITGLGQLIIQCKSEDQKYIITIINEKQFSSLDIIYHCFLKQNIFPIANWLWILTLASEITINAHYKPTHCFFPLQTYCEFYRWHFKLVRISQFTSDKDRSWTNHYFGKCPKISYTLFLTFFCQNFVFYAF